MSDWTTHRARVASLTRSRPADDPDLLAARLSLRASRLEDCIAKAVAAWPPLTAEQLDRLGALLRPSAGGGPSAA